MRTTFTAVVLTLLTSPVFAASNEMVPLQTIIEELEGESVGERSLSVTASRCAANRAWAQIRQTQSFEISGKIEEQEMAQRMEGLTYTWLDIAVKIGQVLDPITSSDDIFETTIMLHQAQVESYNESAFSQKALTGHYIPKTWPDDGQVCKTFEEQSALFLQ